MVKNNNDKWGALSISERASFIDRMIKEHNISDLKTIKSVYNEYSSGGDTNEPPADITPAIIYADYPREAEVWKQADASNADIVERLKQGASRATIPDWEDPRKEATHKMFSAGNYVTGVVQNIDGNLKDFSNPKYGYKTDKEVWEAALDSALERGDYIEFETPGDARYFAEHYKKHYNSFGEGSWKDTALLGASFIPFVGTGVDIYNLIKDPSWENAGWAALSLGSDVLGLTALKGLAKSAKLAKGVKAVKALEQAKTAEKYAEAVKKGIQLEHTGNPKKIALAAGRRGQAYYDNLVATRQLRDATIQAENLAAKSKILSTADKTIDFSGNIINEKDALKEVLYASGGRILDEAKEENINALGGPLYNKYNPIESFSGSSKIPVVRAGTNVFDEGGSTEEGGWPEDTLEQRKRRHGRYDPAGGLGPISQGLYVLMGGNKSRGEENEYWKAYLGLDNNVPKMNPNAKTSWDDEVEQQKINSGELPSDFYGTTSRMDLNIQAIADTLNTGKIYRDYDKYKTMYPKLPAKWIVEEIYNTGKRVLENPNEWQQVDGDNTAIKRGLDISTNEVNPLGMLANFGMMWNPEEKAIYIHDTYDFPKTSRLLVGDRPKEMKIRSKISFDPKKGSKLLRDNMKNFFDYPEPISEK